MPSAVHILVVVKYLPTFVLVFVLALLFLCHRVFLRWDYAHCHLMTKTTRMSTQTQTQTRQ